MATLCYITLFGGPHIHHAEQVPAHFGNRKVATLLAYLALFPDRATSREALAEMLWPDENPDATRDRFRQALSTLRRLLEPEESLAGKVLVADRTGVHLYAEAVSIDTSNFENLLRGAVKEDDAQKRIATLTQALDLAQQELLPGFYEEWALTARTRLMELQRDALSLLSTAYADQNDLPAALDAARRTVALDPLREDAHLQVIRIYASMGRMSDAIRQYRDMERLLNTELGSAPSAATQAEFARVREGVNISPVQPTITHSVPTSDNRIALEAEGGAVPLGSAFYLVRETDREFEAAIRRQDSIVLVKGGRQVGKTSLLARGLQQARRSGTKVILCDLQKLTTNQLLSADSLFLSLAEIIAEQLELEVDLERFWSTPRGWNVKFERFLRREVFGKIDTPIVWGLDEIDRLFEHPFQTEVFGLFRSWHNERSLDPDTHLSRLTLAIAYATEAHLFITDLNQSPFNVGTRLLLEDFTLAEVAEINRRYGSPLHDTAELERYYILVGGNPYLVRRGLHAITTQGLTLDAIETDVAPEHGIFGDALRRMIAALKQDERLSSVIRDLLQGNAIPDPDSFYRLRSAGVIVGTSEQDARIGRKLYTDYLRRHLR